MAELSEADQARLAAYCDILGVPMSSTEPNPQLALQVLARMYLVPTIESHADRNRTLNEIRGNLAGHFDKWSVFVGRTAMISAQMQELPHWFQHQNASTEVLIKRYKSLSTGIFILQFLGIGATAGSAVAAGIAQGSKEGSVKAGAKRMGQRLAGQGPLLEEIQRRIGFRLTPAKTNIVGAVVVVGGATVYFNALEQQEELRLIIMQRFQEGEVTDGQFREVFGDRIDPAMLKKYWEL